LAVVTYSWWLTPGPEELESARRGVSGSPSQTFHTNLASSQFCELSYGSFCCSIMADRTTSDDSAGSGALAARALVRPCTHAPGVRCPKGIPRPHLRAPLDFLCAPPNLRTCIPGCAQFITQLGPFWSAVRSAVDGPIFPSRSVRCPLRPLRPLLVTYISLSLSAPLPLLVCAGATAFPRYEASELCSDDGLTSAGC
jgi:hypothetical protein